MGTAWSWKITSIRRIDQCEEFTVSRLCQCLSNLSPRLYPYQQREPKIWAQIQSNVLRKEIMSKRMRRRRRKYNRCENQRESYQTTPLPKSNYQKTENVPTWTVVFPDIPFRNIRACMIRATTREEILLSYALSFLLHLTKVPHSTIHLILEQYLVAKKLLFSNYS